MTIHEDNMGAIKLSKNWISSKRSKHIEIKYHHIRELVENGEIELKHVRTECQPADILTKNVPRAVFEKYRRSIMNLDLKKREKGGKRTIWGGCQNCILKHIVHFAFTPMRCTKMTGN